MENKERGTYPELKGCPFCGSTEVRSTTAPTQGKKGFCAWVCPECIAAGPFGKTKDEATKLWNKRRNKWKEKQI